MASAERPRPEEAGPRSTTDHWRVDPQALQAFRAGVAQASSDEWFELRGQLEQRAIVPGFKELIALDANRINELPHQTDVALRVLKDMGGRGLLCDEVGLGKTIEAGLALRELSVRGLARRVLIITPAALVSQWQAEMETKFFEPFTTPQRPEEWQTADRAIVSYSRACNPRHRQRITSRPWDLVIVDEAHKAKNHQTANYKLIQALRRDYILLLTATPLQNDLREFYNLVTLLRPGQFGTWKEFRSRFLGRRGQKLPDRPERIRDLAAEVMIRTRRANVDLNLPPRDPVHPRIELTPPERKLYAETERFVRELYRDGFHKATAEEKEQDRRRRRSPTGRGVFALELIRLGQRLCSSSPALASSLLEKAGHENVRPEYRYRARMLAQQAREITSHAKLNSLTRDLKEFEGRVIVFTEHLPTLRLVAEHAVSLGRPVVKYYGGLTPDLRDRAIKNFHAAENGVFVSTRSGTEGLNLQFANVLVNYELPWNPTLVEQRIGRLHRIGQEQVVRIRNYAAAGTVEDRVLRVLAEKIRLFELVVGELDVILGRFGENDSLERRFGEAWLEAETDAEFEAEIQKLEAAVEESRREGIEQERRSSAVAPRDAAERLEADFTSIEIPARVRLGYGTRHLKLLDGVDARRQALGLHVAEIQQALQTDVAQWEAAGRSDYGPTVRITGVTSRGRRVELRVAADRLPIWLLEVDADPEAPLGPGGER